jgi:hypothetical protein
MLKYHKIDNVIIAELTKDAIVISDVSDALDLLGDAGVNDSNMLIIRESNLNPDFFKLYTGFAGEILQKFSTYDFKLAIVGDFSKYNSKNLQDFIRESNRGNRIYFVNTYDDAVRVLTGHQRNDHT